jgi:DNA-binding XRE family transcriptional regulator
MKLEEYLYKRKLNSTELAEIAGVSRQTIDNIVKLGQEPHFSTAEKLEKATEGFVKIDELVGQKRLARALRRKNKTVTNENK